MEPLYVIIHQSRQLQSDLSCFKLRLVIADIMNSSQKLCWLPPFTLATWILLPASVTAYYAARMFSSALFSSRELRALVVEMVLATDMSCHFQQVKAMKNFLQQPEGSVDFPSSLFTLPALSQQFASSLTLPADHCLLTTRCLQPN